MEGINNYTTREVMENINNIQKRIDDVYSKRFFLDMEIKNLKKQLEYWKNLDTSQTKII